MKDKKIDKLKMLCLGDSYTIGESVAVEERFPNQAATMLKEKKIFFAEPTIIAKTGWTTDELATAISEAQLEKKYNFVTLLIGVNNQYRGRDLANYEQEFTDLLDKAIKFAGGKKERVIVISIPDWGVTPFVENDAKKRSGATISQEVAAFNVVNKKVAERYQTHYIDIYPNSQDAKQDAKLLAQDGLHPSGKMYAVWANKVAKQIEAILK